MSDEKQRPDAGHGTPEGQNEPCRECGGDGYHKMSCTGRKQAALDAQRATSATGVVRPEQWTRAEAMATKDGKVWSDLSAWAQERYFDDAAADRTSEAKAVVDVPAPLLEVVSAATALRELETRSRVSARERHATTVRLYQALDALPTLAARTNDASDVVVPPTIATDDAFREPYCQGYRHAVADMRAKQGTDYPKYIPPDIVTLSLYAALKAVRGYVNRQPQGRREGEVVLCVDAAIGMYERQEASPKRSVDT